MTKEGTGGEYVLIPIYGRVNGVWGVVVAHAKVSPEDEVLVSKYRWNLRNGYAVSKTPMVKGETKTIKIHRIILQPDNDMFCDHINRNPLDNRRSNLRIASPKQSAANRRSKKNRTGYIGVTQIKKGYRAKIFDNGKYISFPIRQTKDEAALDHGWAAKLIQGDFALLNFPHVINYVPKGVSKDWLENQYAPKRRGRFKSETGFHGVSKEYLKYSAKVWFEKKALRLGTYSTAEEAARAVDAWEIENMGDKAMLNFPNSIRN